MACAHRPRRPKMLSGMERRTERLLERIQREIEEAASVLERTEAAEFFGELADRAYARSEALLVDDEPDAQDYDEDEAY